VALAFSFNHAGTWEPHGRSFWISVSRHSLLSADRSSGLNAALQEGLAAVKRSFDLLDEGTPEIFRFKPDAKPLVVSVGAVVLFSTSPSNTSGQDGP